MVFVVEKVFGVIERLHDKVKKKDVDTSLSLVGAIQICLAIS